MSTATADLLTALHTRRSVYGINNTSPISDERIQEIIREAILYTPSAFNSQSTRIVLLLGKEHEQLWNMTTNVLKTIVPADQFVSTQQKMDSFIAGHGTILFFEDEAIVRQLQNDFALYQDRFPGWAQHTNAMHQMVIWTALANEGLGASLQHYNPLIDEVIKETWKLPETWQLIAQMPFGAPTAQPGAKQKQPVEDRFKVFKG